MRIKENMKYPRVIEVEVADFEEETGLRDFVETCKQKALGPDNPPAAETPEKPVLEPAKTDPDYEPETPEKPEITEGFRNLTDDQQERPSIIAMKHIIETAKENGATTQSGAMKVIYGEKGPSPNTKLYDEYNRIWKDLKES